MSLPTCAIDCWFFDASGRPAADVTISAVLDRWDAEAGGMILERPVSVTTGPDGHAVFNLWPTARGTKGSSYVFTVTGPRVRRACATAGVPDVPQASLHEIAPTLGACRRPA